MNSYLCHVETGLPQYPFSQEALYERIAADYPEVASRRILKAFFSASGIDRRYCVLPDVGLDPGMGELYWKTPGQWPTTGMRNNIYARECPELAIPTARRALANAKVAATEVTHVITVSCTGFYSPGLDCELIRDLGLNPGVERYHLGFMGCYGAMPALRMAHHFCSSNPNALVLVVCIELCSLHLRAAPDVDTLLANTLFADGAAVAIVSGTPRSDCYVRLGSFYSHVATDAQQHMAWTIQDDGYHLRLSTQIPQLIGESIDRICPAVIYATLQDWGEQMRWAVHPGGRGILDKLEECLSLSPTALAASRAVLRQFGNMSSPTVLFVLKELTSQASAGMYPICSMSFGPGLTLESWLGTIVCTRSHSATNHSPRQREILV